MSQDGRNEVDLPSAVSLADLVTASVRALGGQARRDDIINHAVGSGPFNEAQRAEPPHRRGAMAALYASELHYRLGWALSHAKNAGMLVRSGRAVWALPGSDAPVQSGDDSRQAPVEQRRKKRRKFRAIDMPDQFVLECLTADGGWIDWGLYSADQFTRDADGTYGCAGYGASALFLRCLRQDGWVIYVVDGGGEPFTYRLCPVGGEVGPHG